MKKWEEDQPKRSNKGSEGMRNELEMVESVLSENLSSRLDELDLLLRTQGYGLSSRSSRYESMDSSLGHEEN